MALFDFLSTKVTDSVWEWLTDKARVLVIPMIAIIETYYLWFLDLDIAFKIPVLLWVLLTTLFIFSLGTYIYERWFLTLNVKISFNPEDITDENLYEKPLIGKPNEQSKVVGKAKYIRVKVENTKKKAITCTATLSRIDGLRKPFLTKKDLVWKMKDEPTEIKIANNSPCHFDIAMVSSLDNKLYLRPPEISAALENITHGKIIFTVQVHSDGLSSKPYKVGIELNGKWDEIKGFNP